MYLFADVNQYVMKKVGYSIGLIVVLMVCGFWGCVTKDNCDGVLCQNGGTCNDGFCECPSGYGGPLCQTFFGACDGIVCQNGGTCVGSGTCDCPRGFTGALCEKYARPIGVTYKKIKLKKFPSQPNATQGWDQDASGPDIMFSLGEKVGNSCPNTNFTESKLNCVAGTNYEYTTSVAFPTIDVAVVICMWDSDGNYKTAMSGITFISSSLVGSAGFPQYSPAPTEFSVGNDSMQLDVTVAWQY
jgi:hypothetical protein